MAKLRDILVKHSAGIQRLDVLCDQMVSDGLCKDHKQALLTTMRGELEKFWAIEWSADLNTFVVVTKAELHRRAVEDN